LNLEARAALVSSTQVRLLRSSGLKAEAHRVPE
jgi:hypothetical protein